jgi:hypothetical protein
MHKYVTVSDEGVENEEDARTCELERLMTEKHDASVEELRKVFAGA